MKVRAKCISKDGGEGRVMGYYGHRRIKEGQVFDLVPYTKDGKIVSAEMQFSKKWMERVEIPSASVPEKTPTPATAEVETQKQIATEQQPAVVETATGDTDVI